TLVVDKTGTLTEGRPRLAAIDVASGWNEDDLLALAAAVERGSEHPLASAILRAAEERRLTIPAAADFASSSGRGVSARVDGRHVDLGNVELLRTRGIEAGALADRLDVRR